MRTIRRILVAIKNPNAKVLPALDKAVQLARAFRADMELFHAIATPLYTGRIGRGVGVEQQVAAMHRMKVKHRLEAIAAALRKQRLTVTTHAGWDFPAAEAIVRRALRIDADFIVAECHRGQHRGGWLLKLTDWELVRLSAVPLLLVKSKRRYRQPIVLAAVDPSHAYAKPAALDAQILQCARSVQRALRGTLHVVHAHGPIPWEGRRFLGLDPETGQMLKDRSRTEALARLKPLLKKIKVPDTRRHLVAADPISGVATVARAVGSSIVVMGAISRSGLKRLFIGNTAEQILDAIKCDVLVVKPPDFVSPVASRRRQRRAPEPTKALKQRRACHLAVSARCTGRRTTEKEFSADERSRSTAG